MNLPPGMFDFGLPAQGDVNADIEAQIGKLKGRSQAQRTLSQLNRPMSVPVADVMGAQQGLEAWRTSPLNPSNMSKELVPYNRGAVEAAYRGGAPATTASTNAVLAQQAMSGQRALPVARPTFMGAQPALPMGFNGSNSIPFGPPAPQRPMFGPNLTSYAQTAASAAGGGGRPFFARFGGGGGGSVPVAPTAAAGGGGFLNTLKGSFRKPTLRGSLPIGLATLGGTMLVNQLPNEGFFGEFKDYANPALLGAGIGGSVAGVPGALVGGGLGIVAGGIGKTIELLGDTKSSYDEKRDSVYQAIEQAGLPDAERSMLLRDLGLQLSLAEGDEQKQMILQNAASVLSAQIAQQVQLQQESETMLASQAMLQRFIQPAVQGITTSAENQAANLRQMASSLPPGLREQALISADQRVTDANRVAGAYAQQMLAQPQLAALQLQQQQDAAALRAAQQSSAGSDIQALLEG